MTATPIVRETVVRADDGVHHRRVWIMATGFRRLKCERLVEGTTVEPHVVEVGRLPENLEDWQLCDDEACFPRRGSDVLV